MTIEQFFKIAEVGEVYVVKLRYRYEWEDSYITSNEIGFFDPNSGFWEWWFDWFEGEQEVEVLAYVKIDEVIFPDRKE